MNERLNQIVRRARREKAITKRAINLDFAAIASAMLAHPELTRISVRPSLDFKTVEHLISSRRYNGTHHDRSVSGPSDARPVTVIRSPSISDLRTEFESLSLDEQQDEVDRHLWALQEPSRTQSAFANFFSAVGIGSQCISR